MDAPHLKFALSRAGCPPVHNDGGAAGSGRRLGRGGRIVLALFLTAACLWPMGAAAQQKAAGPTAVAAKPGDPEKLNTASPAWTVTCVSSGRAVPANCAMEQRLFLQLMPYTG